MPKRPHPAGPTRHGPEAPDYRALVEAAGDIVYAIDLEGRFTYISPRGYEVFGYEDESAARMLGRHFLELVRPSAGGDAALAFRSGAEHPTDRHVFRIRMTHRNGTEIPLEVHGSPLRRDGVMVGRVGIARLLTSQQLSEQVDHAALLHERNRIAAGLRDAIAQVVYGVTPDPQAAQAFLLDVRKTVLADVGRRLGLDDVDMTIVRLVATGASNAAIGREVFLSPLTVKDRVQRLMKRLHARGRAELAVQAVRLGLI
ncbi:MAG: PAS domain S-box protein [Candidatus Binatia bacterium]